MRPKVATPKQFRDLPIVAYASWMGTPGEDMSLNQMVAAREGVRLLFEPRQREFGCKWRRPPMPSDDGWWPYCMDNGRWGFRHNLSGWNEWEFWHMVARMHRHADFLAVPDQPPPIDSDREEDVPDGHGMRSLEDSLQWLDRLSGIPCPLLLVVQDQMTREDVESVLAAHEGLGVFIGGTTPWKLRTAPVWGTLCQDLGRHLHMGRVNSVKRAAYALESGCHSLDGTNFGTLFACNVRRLMGGIRALRKQVPNIEGLPLFTQEKDDDE